MVGARNYVFMPYVHMFYAVVCSSYLPFLLSPHLVFARMLLRGSDTSIAWRSLDTDMHGNDQVG